MLTDRHVIGATLIIGAINGIIFSYYAEAPFIFIDSLHLTSNQFGWLGLIIAAATIIGGYCSRKFSAKLEDNLLLLGGYGMVVGSGLMLLQSQSEVLLVDSPMLSTVQLMVPMAILIFSSFGLVLPKVLSVSLKGYQEVLGTAGALLGLSYYLLVAVLTWFIGILHTGSVSIMPMYFLGLSIITLISVKLLDR